MILYVKIIQILFVFIVLNVKKIYVFIVNLNINLMIINLSELNYREESKNKLEEKIKNIEIKIKNLDIIKENIIYEINKLKESSELEIKFIKILLYTYQYEEKQNNLNYNII